MREWLNKLDNRGKIILTLILVVVLIVEFALLSSTCSDTGSSKDSDVCDVCGGDGYVTYKFLGEGTGVQKGFDTYYRCRGCHGTGRSK